MLPQIRHHSALFNCILCQPSEKCSVPLSMRLMLRTLPAALSADQKQEMFQLLSLLVSHTCCIDVDSYI